MRLHPRTMVVQRAAGEIRMAILKLVEQHDLTIAETIGILAEAISGEVKWLIRQERHPNDPDKGGDEA